MDDVVAIVGAFGLKLTQLQRTEAMLVGCKNTNDPGKFSLEKFARWLEVNIPLLHQ